MTISQSQSQKTERAGSEARAFVIPMLLAGALLAAIVFIQFSGALGQYGFPAEFIVAIGFYYCYAWAKRRAERARAAPPSAPTR